MADVTCILRHAFSVHTNKKRKPKQNKTLSTGHTSLCRFKVFLFCKGLGNFLCLKLKCDRQPYLCISATRTPVGILSIVGSIDHLIVVAILLRQICSSLSSNLCPTVLFPRIFVYMIVFISMLTYCVIQRKF